MYISLLTFLLFLFSLSCSTQSPPPAQTVPPSQGSPANESSYKKKPQKLPVGAITPALPPASQKLGPQFSLDGNALLAYGPSQLFGTEYIKGTTLSDHAPLEWQNGAESYLTWNILQKMKNNPTYSFYNGVFENTPFGTPDETEDDYKKRADKQLQFLSEQMKSKEVLLLQEVSPYVFSELRKKRYSVQSGPSANKKLSQKVIVTKTRTTICRNEIPSNCPFIREKDDDTATVAYDSQKVYVSIHAKMQPNSQPDFDTPIDLLTRIEKEPLFKRKKVIAGGDFNGNIEDLANKIQEKGKLNWTLNWTIVTYPGEGQAGGKHGGQYQKHPKPIDGFISFDIP